MNVNLTTKMNIVDGSFLAGLTPVNKMKAKQPSMTTKMPLIFIFYRRSLAYIPRQASAAR